MNRLTIPSAHLVLVGGGHSHVQTLRRLMMRPAERGELYVTLIAREVHTPYSGMLPGRVAGYYASDEMHIDLARLCQAANVRLVLDEVVELDADCQCVALRNHPPLVYNILSLNCGASPGFAGVEIEAPIIPVKPIGQFLSAWEGILAGLQNAISQGSRRSLAVVGAGAGGVELSLAIAKALEPNREGMASLRLVECLDEILPGHNARVKGWAERRLARAGIAILKGFQVSKVTAQGLVNEAGTLLEADHVLWTTGVSAPPFLRQSGLELDSQGFVSVNEHLQSLSHQNLFAAGDVAHLSGQPRPKSGVYAVRAGPWLTDNLFRFASGKPLKPYKAQPRALAIIGDSQGSAVASKGGFYAAGNPIFALKQLIDRRFMNRFETAPMEEESPDSEGIDSRMRCAGCGAKLPASILDRVLKRIQVASHDEVLQGIGEDAALLQLSPQTLAVSTDHFPQMVSDPYKFGRISAHHALSDLYAMGARPRYALVNLSLELMSPELMEEEMYLLLRGVNDVLANEDVALIGGHSTEAEKTQLGCTVFGDLASHAFSKGALESGDLLVLTKPIGIGVILAGDMRVMTKGHWLEMAIESMDQSNASAAKLLREHGARSCTDITGFGLLGHLLEMVRASGCSAQIQLDSVPYLEGANELMASGVQSSLQIGNEAVLEDVELSGVSQADSRFRLLMDPQTSGGLLAGIKPEKAEGLLQVLRAAGYPQAQIVGSAFDFRGPKIIKVLATV